MHALSDVLRLDLCRILADKEKEEKKLRAKLEAAIASGDKDALMRAIKEAKLAGLADAGKASLLIISQSEVLKKKKNLQVNLRTRTRPP